MERVEEDLEASEKSGRRLLSEEKVVKNFDWFEQKYRAHVMKHSHSAETQEKFDEPFNPAPQLVLEKVIEETKEDPAAKEM